MQYYAITETVEIPIYQEPKEYSKEDIDKQMKDFKMSTSFFSIDTNPPFKPIMVIPMSEETFKFISCVANISCSTFGEKDYKINKVKFKIFTKEDYELRYGKLEKTKL